MGFRYRLQLLLCLTAEVSHTHISPPNFRGNKKKRKEKEPLTTSIQIDTSKYVFTNAWARFCEKTFVPAAKMFGRVTLGFQRALYYLAPFNFRGEKSVVDFDFVHESVGVAIVDHLRHVSKMNTILRNTYKTILRRMF